MQRPIYKNPNAPDADQIYRTNRIVWAAMLFSQMMFLVLVFFARPRLFSFSASGTGEAGGLSSNFVTAGSPILIFLAVIALITFTLSFVLKTRMLKLAIDNKQIELAQSAQIVAYALCEVTTLFGLIAAFAFNSGLFFAWFALGIFGLLLHFPRRRNFEAASFTGIN